MSPRQGLLDTSIFIGVETGRPLERGLMPPESLVSVITLGELQVGVHAATDAATRALRMQTLESAFEFEPLTVDVLAAGIWAMLRAKLADAGRRANVNDLWIAAVATAHDLPVVTQDNDFDVIADLGGPEIIRV